MDDISRRQVVGAAAVAGALALAGRAGAEDKPKDAFDEKVSEILTRQAEAKKK